MTIPANSLLIHPDGTTAGVYLPEGEQRHLDTMRKAIDCNYVDVVRLTQHMDMWLDDEGRLSNMIGT